MTTITEYVNVNITNQKGIVSAVQFSNILIIGKTNPAGFTGVKEYTTLNSMVTAGFAADTPEYKAAEVIFQQTPSVDKIKIVQRTTTDGVYEKYTLAYDRAKKDTFVYAVLVVGDITTDEYVELKELCSTISIDKTQLVINLKDSVADRAFRDELTLAKYSRVTVCFNYGDIIKNLHSGILGVIIPLQPGTVNLAFREIKGVLPDDIGNAEAKILDSKNINYYTETAGFGNFQRGVTLAGEWVDEIYAIDWLTNLMQVTIYNILRSTDKIPFTDSGINMIKVGIDSCLRQAVLFGVIEPTYKIVMGKVNTIDKLERLYKGSKFYISLPGSIQKTDPITGIVTSTIIEGTLI